MARRWLYVGTLEESSHTDLTPGFLSCNLPFLHGKECDGCPQWARRCSQQEIPDCWGRCFVVMSHSTPVMEFLGQQASLGHAGPSAWCSDLAAGVLLGKRRGKFEVLEVAVARSTQCPRCVWVILTCAFKSVVPSRWQALVWHLGYCHALLGAQTATQYLWSGNVALKCPQVESTIQYKYR